MWIDPIAFYIGSIAIHWYGIAWALAFLLVLYYPSSLVKSSKKMTEHWQDIVSTALLASVIGGRLGEMIFFQMGTLLAHPLKLFAIREGGMSFHGALILGSLAFIWLSRRYKIDFWSLTDAALINLPLALGIVRIANFINGELWGRITDQSWGVAFPGSVMLRHPSQLYEAFLEGLVLWGIMRLAVNYNLPKGYLTAIFFIGYASLRLIVETFYREPTYDWVQILSTGQLLCIGMITIGVLMGMHHWQQKG